ncbi:MAG: hypothetical protein AAB702_02170 [Patescibacteria group bacterium]
MKELLNNKKLVSAGGVVILVVVFLGFFLLMNKSSNNQNNQDTVALPTQIPVPTITADSLGLTLKTGVEGKTVIVALANAVGISAIEYELSYTSKGDIPRGAIGQLDLTKKPVKKEITLGTCSDTCHYDEDVSNIKILLKITKTDGKVYQAEQVLTSVSE